MHVVNYGGKNKKIIITMKESRLIYLPFYIISRHTKFLNPDKT